MHEIEDLAFNADGSFDLSTRDKRLAACETTLVNIAVTPQAYSERGAEWCRDRMQRAADEMLRLLRAEREGDARLGACGSRWLSYRCARLAGHEGEGHDDGRFTSWPKPGSVTDEQIRALIDSPEFDEIRKGDRPPWRNLALDCRLALEGNPHCRTRVAEYLGRRRGG